MCRKRSRKCRYCTVFVTKKMSVPPPSLCRCCLAKDTPCKDLLSDYDWMGEKQVYADMMLESFNITLDASECGTEAGICAACATRLRDAASFKRQVLDAERQFRSILLQIKEEREHAVKAESSDDEPDSSEIADPINTEDDKEDLKDDVLPLSTFVKKKGAKRRASPPAPPERDTRRGKSRKTQQPAGSTTRSRKALLAVKKDPDGAPRTEAPNMDTFKPEAPETEATKFVTAVVKTETVKTEDPTIEPPKYTVPISSSPNVNGTSQLDVQTVWTSTGDLKEIEFTKQQMFNAEIGPEPMDYFTFFVDEDFLLLICTETNLHCEKTYPEDVATPGAWYELTVDELKVFIGLLLHMGTFQVNRIHDYWKTGRLFNIPIFREQMTENRFFHILRCLRFASDETGNDPLAKVREVVYYFNEKMDRCYYPSKELSLDGMTLWKGQLKRQNVGSRKYRNGIKLSTLNETDGTVIRIHIDGKNKMSKRERIDKTVMNLMKGKLQNGHSVYTSGYYSSYNLAKRLLDKGTHCTGMLRKALSDNPKDLTSVDLKKGEEVKMFREGVHIGKWKDKRTVTYVSTECRDLRTVINKKGHKLLKPEALHRYESYALEKNRRDQTLAFYPCVRTTLRWYKKVFIHALQLLLANSHKFYNKYSGKSMSFNDFRLSVIDSLLPQKLPLPTKPPPAPRINIPSVPVNVHLNIVPSSTTHSISKILERNSSGRIKRKMCRLCSKSGKRADSIYHCVQCYGQPGLCVGCFEIFHSMTEQ